MLVRSVTEQVQTAIRKSRFVRNAMAEAVLRPTSGHHLASFQVPVYVVVAVDGVKSLPTRAASVKAADGFVRLRIWNYVPSVV